MDELKERLESLLEKKGKPCPVIQLMTDWDKETKDAFNKVLSSKAKTVDIHRELVASGYRIGRDTLSYHRNGFCRCGSDHEAE